MTQYQKINNLLGWLTFCIAAFVYIATIEPTASFWDCGEYIATAYKFEVGHPPGAPLFLLIARLFSLFAAGDVSAAAKWVNTMSALCNAFTILFLFWTITAFAKKIAEKSEALTISKMYIIFGSGLVGALAYTFSDSFWFSGVEGEVYAMSSFFTAIVFWVILKWESVANEQHADRWIILIAYLMGLSIGVHLLNLLAIPAITFVYYFKKNTPTRKGLILTGILSVVLLGGVQGGIIPGIVKLAAGFELFFVNTLNLPFNSGIIFYAIALISLIIWGLIYTTRKNKPVLNTIILSFMVLLIGYSSFAVLVIRSQANTPLDENNPENPINLLSYLNREQYGDWPILYGQYYNSPLNQEQPYKDGTPVYAKDEKVGKYIVSDDRKASVPNYDSKFCTIFPRMHSQQENHIAAYKQWGDVKGERINITNMRGEKETIVKPTFLENLTYFKNYQVGWMYFRYFMWNFSGRQNDIQGHGNNTEGNWITGINFIDELRLGSQAKLPSILANNKGRNVFYGLPFLLGLLGLYFHFKQDAKDAFVVMLLFIFTGLAIVVYLNQYPYQPRERDYAYAASFYGFAIWIGLGVYAIFETLRKKMPEKQSAIFATATALLAVPTIMATAGWDDHNRSNRYTTRDFAINYLNSCAPNAILFTNGDNDTFPLWYVQEVEGIRTDVRVCNLSLLNTDWYIDQMKRKAYDSNPIPFSLTLDKYRQGTRDYLPYYDRKIDGYIQLKELIDFVSSDNKNNQLEAGNGRFINYFPTNKMRIPVDTQKVIANGTVQKSMASRISPLIDWELNKNYIMKNDLMVLDLLAHNNWDRPIYFAVTTGADSYLNLENYFQLEGLAYRLVPIKSTSEEQAQGVRVATNIMYANLMNNFKWGNMDKPGIYLDENILRMATNMRIQTGTLAAALVAEGKKDSAIKVLDKCIAMMPEMNVPYDATMFSIIVAYYQAGAIAQPNKLAERLFNVFEENVHYYRSLTQKEAGAYVREAKQADDILQRLVYVTQSFKQTALSKKLEARVNALYGSSAANNQMLEQRQ